MKVLVIGGSKFIGLHLVRKLVELEHDVTVFNIEASCKMLPTAVKHIKGNRKDHKLVETLFKDETFDIIFDTCGFEASDVEIFIDVFKNKIKQYIFCSTTSVYDFSQIQHLPLDEEFPLKNQPQSSDYEICYGSNKVLCEKALLSNGYFPVTIFRPCYVYGPCAYDNRVEFYFSRICDGREIPLPPIGDNIVHFIHVSDLAELFVSAIGNIRAYNKIYNGAGSETTTMHDFIKLCGQVVGRETNIRVFNPEKISAFLTVEEVARIMPVKIYPFSLCFDTSKAHIDLNWKPKFNLQEGIKNTYEWYKPNKLLVDYSIDDKVLRLVSDEE